MADKKPNFRAATWTHATGLAAFLALAVVGFAPTASAATEYVAGTGSAEAVQETTTHPPFSHGVSSEATANDLVVPPSDPLGTQTTVTLKFAGNAIAWISDACAYGANPACSAIAEVWIRKTETNSDLAAAACSTGSGCPEFWTGVGVYDENDFYPRIDVTIQHDVLGLNSETVLFWVCAEARIYEDQDGDGQWSDEAPEKSKTCDLGTVRVDPF